MLKKLREKLRNSKVLDGYLTYAGLAGVVTLGLVNLVGLPADGLQENVVQVLEGVGALVAIVGRYRHGLKTEAPQV